MDEIIPLERLNFGEIEIRELGNRGWAASVSRKFARQSLKRTQGILAQDKRHVKFSSQFGMGYHAI